MGVKGLKIIENMKNYFEKKEQISRKFIGDLRLWR